MKCLPARCPCIDRLTQPQKPCWCTICSIAQVRASSLLHLIRWLLCHLRLIYPRPTGYMFPYHEHAARRMINLSRGLVLRCRNEAVCRSSEGLRSSRPWPRLGICVCSSLHAAWSVGAEDAFTRFSMDCSLFYNLVRRNTKACHHVFPRTSWI